MNLTELQMELRSIEEHISKLHNEIEKMKPQSEEEKRENFEKITRLAQKHPVRNSVIASAEFESKKIFVSSLLHLMLLDESNLYTRLLYLTRFSYGCGLDMSAEELYKAGLEFEINDIDKLCRETPDYKYTYLIEAFIIANLPEKPSIDILSNIAYIAEIMECDKEEIRVTAQVAKSRLMDDMDQLLLMPVLSKKRWEGKFGEYIPHDWIIKQRRQCGTLCTLEYKKRESNSSWWMSEEMGYTWSHPQKIKQSLQNGSIVKKDEVICSYAGDQEGQTANRKKELKITAPCDGVVYFIEEERTGSIKDKNDKYLIIYVVSYFDEFHDLYMWHKENQERRGIG